MKISGIYAIVNCENGKRYIGQSSDIEKRRKKHFEDLENGCHPNIHLQKSYIKYGKENFEFSIIEECDRYLLNEKEKYWIKYFNSKDDGYNMNDGGDGVSGFVHTEEQIEKMRKSSNPRPVVQFDENFNLLKKYMGGYIHAAKENNFTKECILRSCKHEKGLLLYKNSYWIYEDEYYSSDFSWEKYLNYKKISGTYKKTTNKIHRKIVQYTIDREVVKIWDSASDLRDCGYNTQQIYTICNHRKNKKTHKGFLWSYEGYDFSDGYFDGELNPKVRKSAVNIPIRCVYFDGLVKDFDSLTQASKEIGLSIATVHRILYEHQQNDLIKEITRR